MDAILDYIQYFTLSPRVMFYLMIIYAVVVIIATIAWCVSLFLEVTKKRASKLSIKYGSARPKEGEKKNVVKLVLYGIALVVAWIIFVIVF